MASLPLPPDIRRKRPLSIMIAMVPFLLLSTAAAISLVVSLIQMAQPNNSSLAPQFQQDIHNLSQSFGAATVILDLVAIAMLLPPAILLLRDTRVGKIWAAILAAFFIFGGLYNAVTGID